MRFRWPPKPGANKAIFWCTTCQNIFNHYRRLLDHDIPFNHDICQDAFFTIIKSG
jgi:hypothetical protein